MSIDLSKYPTGTESSRLHGLSFGVLDAARKIHSQIEQHLGLVATEKPTTAGDVEAMLDEAGAMMTRMMRMLESGSDPAITPPPPLEPGDEPVVEGPVPAEAAPAGDATPAPAV